MIDIVPTEGDGAFVGLSLQNAPSGYDGDFAVSFTARKTGSDPHNPDPRSRRAFDSTVFVVGAKTDEQARRFVVAQMERLDPGLELLNVVAVAVVRPA